MAVVVVLLVVITAFKSSVYLEVEVVQVVAVRILVVVPVLVPQVLLLLAVPQLELPLAA